MASLTTTQYDMLMRPLRGSRVAKRSQGGKQLSYLEAFDVRAHLIRLFGFCNFDAEVIDSGLVGLYPYKNNEREMMEVAWHATVRLTIRDQNGEHLCTYAETAVGSATGSAASSGIGDLHDNAVKQAESDALKRCAINLGTQMGLSLYNDGQTADVVKQTLVKPEGWTPPEPTPEQQAALATSVGAQ